MDLEATVKDLLARVEQLEAKINEDTEREYASMEAMLTAEFGNVGGRFGCGHTYITDRMSDFLNMAVGGDSFTNCSGLAKLFIDTYIRPEIMLSAIGVPMSVLCERNGLRPCHPGHTCHGCTVDFSPPSETTLCEDCKERAHALSDIMYCLVSPLNGPPTTRARSTMESVRAYKAKYAGRPPLQVFGRVRTAAADEVRIARDSSFRHGPPRTVSGYDPRMRQSFQ